LIEQKKIMIKRYHKTNCKEVQDGYYVNLGMSSSIVPNCVRNDIEIEFQSENGVLEDGTISFRGEEGAAKIL
jgi:acyl CoA:acetate/3-ketoacid CoA transferase beta subunit